MTPQEYLKSLENEHERVSMQMDALNDAFKKQAALIEEKSLQMGQLETLFERARHRIRYIEELPGRRVPYVINFQIEIPLAAGIGSTPTNPQALISTNKGLPYSDVKRIEKDGPFVATTYLSAFKLKTYSLGPLPGTPPEIPPGTDPVVGTEIITPLTGRFRPISSSTDPFSGAYIGPGPGTLSALNVFDTTSVGPNGGAFAVNTFRPGSIDFLWGVVDEGVERQRQNGQAIIPSRCLFSDFDRPLYLPVSDYFERGASVRFNAELTHDLGYIEMNYSSYSTTSVGSATTGDQVWAEAFNAVTGVALGVADSFAVAPLATRARRVFGLGGTLYFSMLGYKIAQPMEPAV